MRTTTTCTALLAASLALPGCSMVSETGRSQFAPIPESIMNSLGATSYAEATGEYPEVRGTAEADMIRRVGQKIATASGRNYAWEFKLLDAPDVINAFCLPGGKIAVYTGMLAVTQNEAGLAAVMGHEVAHATSHHGNERMSQGLLLQVGLAGVQALADGWDQLDDEKRDTVMGLLGLGAQVGITLPFSREHESEADEIGLRFMIRAGYDPYESVALWERMAQLSGNDTPELLSTHPLPDNRARALREMIPRIVAEESAGRR